MRLVSLLLCCRSKILHFETYNYKNARFLLMRATSFLFIKRHLAVLLPISIHIRPRVIMLLRRRHEILPFNITEPILSVMTEL